MTSEPKDTGLDTTDTIIKLRAEIAALRVQHNAWCAAFGTTQLTHALAEIEQLRSDLQKADHAIDKMQSEINGLRPARITPERAEVEKLALAIARSGWMGCNRGLGVAAARDQVEALLRYVCGTGGRE